MGRDEQSDLTDRIAALLKGTVHGRGPHGGLLDELGFARTFNKVERSKRSGFTRQRQLRIFARDHFVDRYTGEKLFFPGVLLLLGAWYPSAFPAAKQNEGWRVGQCHWIYWRLWPTVDHVRPVARGGDPIGDSNLVTTSQMMNSAKSAWAAEELPPQIRLEPIEERVAQAIPWDGMLGWFLEYAGKAESTLNSDPRLQAWHAAAVSFRRRYL